MTEQTCPNCNSVATGKFCAACGASLAPRACTSCGARLPASARFCQDCGTPAGGVARTARAVPFARETQRRNGPWIVAGVLSVIAISAILYAARSPTGSVAAANPGSTAVAPDISNMTPREQFDRLIDRITTAAEQGDTGMLARFWPMASGAYQNLPPGDRDNDARFHMGWLHVLAGQYAEANALADTIMTFAPNHLLAYYLQAGVAKARGDSAKSRALHASFISHFDAEIAKTDVTEYAQHRAMLDKFKAQVSPAQP
jgi:ribosomal protein L40E